MTLINYHVHTYLCGHATGTIDEYINTAISRGLKEIGFADHAPIPLRFRKGITMDPEEVDYYIDEIIKRKSEYEKSINIRLGFEVDYPLTETFNRDLFNDSRIDFIIGSCHFIKDWPFDHPGFIDEYDRRDINDVYAAYYSIIDSLAASSLFDIVGHIDIVKKFGHRPSKDFSPEIEAISKKLSKNGTAVEINTAGLKKPVGEIYPSDEIIDILFRNNVPVTISSDCHSPDDIDYMLQEALEKLKKAGYRKISCFHKRKRYEYTI